VVGGGEAEGEQSSAATGPAGGGGTITGGKASGGSMSEGTASGGSMTGGSMSGGKASGGKASGGAMAGMNHASHGGTGAGGGNSAGGPQAIDHYTCPMHPSVRAHEPGKCPICGMTLVPVPKHTAEPGAVTVDDAERRSIGLQTSLVQKAPLTVTVKALGQVKVDETRQVDVTLRVKGWVHDLKVNATGQAVKKGEVMFTLYSPEVFAAEQEYLLARRTQTAGIAQELVRAAEQKLRLWGLSSAQIAAIAKRGQPIENLPFLAPASGYVLEKNVVEGAEVAPGQKLYRIAPLDHVWIDAQVYEADLPSVQVGQTAQVSLPYAPGKTFEGKVTYVYPTLDAATRTGTVRVELKNADLALKPQMFADVTLTRELGQALLIPEEAVLYTGPRRIVFVDEGKGRLVPRDVTLGARSGDKVQVTQGLEAGERVVTQGQFLVASESRLKSATGFWSEEQQ
jgi:Cu(I)/Ag(I) efflux system membrane fusion protein